jgi:hypothetical protein
LAALGLADHEVAGVSACMPVDASPPVAVLVGTNALQVPGERRARWPPTLLWREQMAQLHVTVARLRCHEQRE